MFKNIVNLILDVVFLDMFNEIEFEERDVEIYRYRLTYGNFFFGGVELDLFLEDVVYIEREFIGERILLREEVKLDFLK